MHQDEALAHAEQRAVGGGPRAQQRRERPRRELRQLGEPARAGALQQRRAAPGSVRENQQEPFARGVEQQHARSACRGVRVAAARELLARKRDSRWREERARSGGAAVSLAVRGIPAVRPAVSPAVRRSAAVRRMPAVRGSAVVGTVDARLRPLLRADEVAELIDEALRRVLEEEGDVCFELTPPALH